MLTSAYKPVANFLEPLLTFSRFRSSFLSDVYCSHSHLNLVGKTITALIKIETDSPVVSASG